MRFVLTIVAVIVGGALLRHVDVKTLQVEKPGLDSLYAIVFIAAIFLIIRDVRKKGQPNQ